MKHKLHAAQPATVSIQLDGWSQHHHGYMGLLANYITKDWKRARVCLACTPFDISHTGQNVARWLEMECDKWNLTEAVGVVTTDTAANMLKMMEYLPIHFQHGGCLNHILQLVIKDELFEKPSIKSLIKTCRALCSFANQSVSFSQSLVRKQMEEGTEESKCLLLQQDVPTRWNSSFLMFKRFLQIQTAVRALLLEDTWQNKLEVSLTNADWSLMEKVVTVLDIFYEATLRFSATTACISEVIPTVTGIIFTLASETRDDHGVKDFKRKLKISMLQRLGAKEDLERYSVATLLDPR